MSEEQPTSSERFIPLWPAQEASVEVPTESGERLEHEEQEEKKSKGSSERQLTQRHLSSPFSLPYTACDVTYVPYESELQMPDIVKIMKASLSEPYSIYTYRYFIHNWPQLCVLAHSAGECVGAIVCKLERHHYDVRRGYIAMLAVNKNFRKRKIGEFGVFEQAV